MARAEKSVPRGMRMAELSRRSGVARETIHFYLREGLLPRPEKDGATIAYYGERHLERLAIIRRLREEKYLPIPVIRRLLESPTAPAEGDVDVLADVLHLIPMEEDRAGPPSPEAAAEAEARGLLGRARPSTGERPLDSAERRVLQVVDEALALEPDARRLTLEDVEACAAALTALVSREAELVFDAMFASGDVGGAIGALRSGRPAVARFIAVYRDLMLRRIVEEVLLALERGPETVLRAATIPLSSSRSAELGVPERRASLRAAFAERADERSVSELAWHLFATGAAPELAALPREAIAPGGPRIGCLVAWAAYERARGSTTLAAFDRAVAAAPGFPLGQILLGEAVVARGLRRRHGGASVLEQAIPALHRVFDADPERDPEPVARAFGWFHRGRTELALPPVLGRRSRGVAALEQSLATLDREPRIEPAARARIGANARLALARHWRSSGDHDRARAMLRAAAFEDPDGAIATAARDLAGDLAGDGAAPV